MRRRVALLLKILSNLLLILIERGLLLRVHRWKRRRSWSHHWCHAVASKHRLSHTLHLLLHLCILIKLILSRRLHHVGLIASLAILVLRLTIILDGGGFVHTEHSRLIFLDQRSLVGRERLLWHILKELLSRYSVNKEVVRGRPRNGHSYILPLQRRPTVLLGIVVALDC